MRFSSCFGNQSARPPRHASPATSGEISTHICQKCQDACDRFSWGLLKRFFDGLDFIFPFPVFALCDTEAVKITSRYFATKLQQCPVIDCVQQI